jgi:hypothetical protein
VPEVDHATCWQALKADLVGGERSRGRDKLLARMAEIEMDNVIPEEQQGYDERPARRTTEATTGPGHLTVA